MIRPRAALLVPLAASLLGGAGCLSGSLASDTGSRQEGRKWSLDSVQQAHVGETVKFDFLILDSFGRAVRPEDVSDYAVLTVGDERHQTEADLHGHYSFSHSFQSVRPGDRVAVRATAYRQRDQRDYMKIGGEWLRYPGATDREDAAVGSDSVRIEIYQAVVDLSLEAPGAEFSAGAGVLEMIRRDGNRRIVYAATDGRRGFSLTREGGDRWRIRYEPTAEELNESGQTLARFAISDAAGRRHEVEGQIDTP